MKVAIVGSRDFLELSRVVEYVRGLPAGTIVVSGGARGVDSVAETAARECGLSVQVFKPDWDKHGLRAGFVRNLEIIGNADRVVAFWNGASRGTKHSISIARNYGKPVEIVLSQAKKIGTLFEEQP